LIKLQVIYFPTEIIKKYYANGLKEITSDLMLVDENVGLITTNYEPNIFHALRLKQLQHLDLSNCALIGNGEALVQLDCLKTLILHNCPRLDLSIENIVKMISLRFESSENSSINANIYFSMQIFRYFNIVY